MDCKLLEYTIDYEDQFWFHFEDSEAVSTLAKNFYLSAAVANVQRFTAAQKMLKSLIYKNKKVKNDYTKYSGRRTAGELCVS